MPSSLNARFVAVAVCGFSAFIDMYATQPLLPELQRTFGAGEAAVGLTISATTFGCALAAPLVGALADRIGRKRVIVSSIVLLALVTFGAAGAATLPVLLAWRTLQGVLMPGVFAVTIAYVAEEFPREIVGRGVAVYITGTVAGGFGGRYIAAVVAAHARWPAAFVVLGALNLIGAAVVLVGLPRARRFVRSASAAASLRAIGGFLRDPQVLATYAVGAGVLFTQVAAFTFATFHLAAPPYVLSTVALGNVFVVYLVGLVATPFGGRVIDRFGSRATTLGALAIAAAGLLLTLAPALAAIVVGLTMMSSGVFVMQTSAQNYLQRVVRAHRSTAAALYVTFYYLGGGLGAIVPAPAWSHGGWPATVAAIVAVQALIALMTAFGWRRRPALVASSR